jgi:hypothetical protein
VDLDDPNLVQHFKDRIAQVRAGIVKKPLTRMADGQSCGGAA